MMAGVPPRGRTATRNRSGRSAPLVNSQTLRRRGCEMRLTRWCVLVGVLLVALPAAGQWSPDDPLMPTGDSTTDTENLRLALHDSRLDNGGTLYLGQGTFYVHGALGRQDFDPVSSTYNLTPFNGTIQGAGKDLTTIRAVKGPGGENFEPVIQPKLDPSDPERINIYAVLMMVGSYIGLKDLTFDSEPELMWDPDNAKWLAPWRGHNAYGGRGPTLYVGAGSWEGGFELIGTDLINVRFKGTVDTDGSPTTGHLYQQWGDWGGVHNVKGCDAENSSNGAVQFLYMTNATINIGGSRREKVTFTNAHLTSVDTRCIDCNVNVAHIETHDAPGVFFSTFHGNTQSSVAVTHSRINPIPDSLVAGVEMWASSGEVSAVISNNKIHSEDSFPWGPIFIEGVSNGVISANKFTGRGPSAIYLGVYEWSPGRFTLVGNNVQMWETTVNPWFLPAAPIWLGSFVTDSTVVGGNSYSNVFDEPAYDTDWNPLFDEDGNPLTIPGYGGLIPPEEFGNLVPKNNVFTGVNNIQVHIGQDVRDAMQQRVEAKQLMMGR